MHFKTILSICFQSLILFGIGFLCIVILLDRFKFLQEVATIISCFSVFLLTIFWFIRKTKVKVHKNDSDAHSNYWSSAEITYILILFLGLMTAVPQHVNLSQDAVIKLNYNYLIKKKNKLKKIIEIHQNGICQANSKFDNSIPIYVGISIFCEELSILDLDNINHDNFLSLDSFDPNKTNGVEDVLNILFKFPPSELVWERIEYFADKKHLEKEHIVSFLKISTKCCNDLLCEKLDNIRAYPLNDKDKSEWESIGLILDEYTKILSLGSDFYQNLISVVLLDRDYLETKEKDLQTSIPIGDFDLFLMSKLFAGVAPLLVSIVLGLRLTKSIAGYKKNDKNED